MTGCFAAATGRNPARSINSRDSLRKITAQHIIARYLSLPANRCNRVGDKPDAIETLARRAPVQFERCSNLLPRARCNKLRCRTRHEAPG